MLPQKNRILRKDFPTGSRQGFRVFSPLFSGVVYPKEKGILRASVVVSKKTAKTAVVRNLLKRRFYALTKLYKKDFLQGTMIVFYPKKESIKASFSEIKAEFEKGLRSARLVK